MKKIIILTVGIMLMFFYPTKALCESITIHATTGQTLTAIYSPESSHTLHVVGNANTSGNLILQDGIYIDNVWYAITSVDFRNCTGLISISLPNTITAIGDYAFNNCTSLSTVSLPNTITSIGNYAFSHTAITSIDFIPSGVTWIGNGAFSYTNIVNAVLPNTVEYCGDHLFSYCEQLTNYTLPSNMDTIPAYFFHNCTLLDTIIIPPQITYISEYAFSYSQRNIKKLAVYADSCNGVIGEFDTIFDFEIGNTVRIIKWSLTAKVGLNVLVIPSSVEYVGLRAFNGCCGLDTIVLPSSVRTISSLAFAPYDAFDGSTNCRYCQSHRRKVFYQGSLEEWMSINKVDDSSLPNIELYLNDTLVTDIVLPSNIDTIQTRALTGLVLNSLVVSDSTRAIKEYAWSHVNKLIVGSSVDTLSGDQGSYITRCNLHVDTVFFRGTVPPRISQNYWSDGYGHSGCMRQVATFVPCENVQAYTNYICGSVYSSTPFPFSITVAGPHSYVTQPSCIDSIAVISCAAAFTDSATNERYGFVGWNDGDTNMSREIYVDRDTSFEALFSRCFSFFVYSSNTSRGGVTIIQNPVCGHSGHIHDPVAIFKATPSNGFKFTMWSDGDTNRQRTITLTQDTILYAYFERDCDQHVLTVPFYSDFSGDCWMTIGDAYIDNGRVAIPSVGDTMISPWFASDSNTFIKLTWSQVETSSPHSEINIDIVSRDGQLLKRTNKWSNSYSCIISMVDIPGQDVRVKVYHAQPDNVASIAVTGFRTCSYYLRASINGPDTVYIGDTATFSIAADQAGYLQLYYSWYPLGNASTIGNNNQSAYSIVWNTPGIYDGVSYKVYVNTEYHFSFVSGDKQVTVLPRPIDCDSITLPYTADFTQCWTAEGGATIIDPNHASISSQGQTLTSLWINMPAGEVYTYFAIRRSLESGFWYSDDSARHFRVTIETADTVWEIKDGVSYGSWMGNRVKFNIPGGNARIVITYMDTMPSPMFNVENLSVYTYPINLVLDMPDTIREGDTASFAAHALLPNEDVPDYWNWRFFYLDGWYDVDSTIASIVMTSDSSCVTVWHRPGSYRLFVNVGKYTPAAYGEFYYDIVVLPQITDCDSITLPYTADFTQCWTAEGAVVIDPNHVSMISVGQKITGPWMESNAGKAFLHFTFNCDNNHEWNSDQTARITIENEDGVFASWEEVVGNWSGLYDFESPGGSIRVKLEYTGSQPSIDFMVSDVLLYSYQIENSLEGPGIVHVGDTVTFTAHATLQDDEVADYYGWSMYVYNSNGSSWVDENDPSRTIVSRTDSTLVVVWNTPGRYSVTSSVYKNNVYHNSNAYASDWMYINVVDFPFYEEDSIYYTSAAKDTVIGCHSELHVANLPESVTVIADSAFFNLSNLSIIELPIGLRTIGKMAFAWNQGISEITIPQNVTFVGDNAFWWDTNLTTVNFNATNCQTMSPSTDNNGNYWPVFIGCNNITTINIGENVTRIPDRAFSYCNGLHGTLTIPDAVTYIGRSAFFHWIDDWDWNNGSSWDTLSIVLGTGLTEIGDYAFGCPRAHITSVISHNPVPPTIEEETFYRYEPEYTPRLQVPCGSATTYRNAQHWSRFEEITEDCDKIEDVIVEDNIKIYVCDGRIVVEGSGDNMVQVFDMMGRLVVAEETLYGGLGLSVPSSGVYMVKIGGMPACKVVVMR